MRYFFSPVERMLAFRYMRSRRAEGFISVIAWFSLAGITLGVATLIVVMSVMNGFRAELVGRILGLNGHVAVYSNQAGGIADFDQLALKITDMPDVFKVNYAEEFDQGLTEEEKAKMKRFDIYRSNPNDPEDRPKYVSYYID
mgnify:CR=1 FL=1